MNRARSATSLTILVLAVSVLPLLCLAEGQTTTTGLGTLKLGLATVPPVINSHYLYYGQANGFYRELGLSLEIIPLNGDQTAARALTAGDIDVAWAGCNSPIQAIDSGAPFTLISAFEPKLDFVLAGRREIARARDLEGRSLGVSQPGAVSHQIPILMVQADGGDPRKVGIVAIGGTSARVQALMAAKVDAAMLDRAALARATSDASLRVIANAPDLLPDYLFGCEYTTRSVLERRSPFLQAFVTGTMKAVRWFYRHQNEAVELTQKILPDTPRPTIEMVLRYYAEARLFNATGTVRREAFDFTVKAGRETGDIKGSPEYDRAVTLRFTEAANATLGPYQP
jgi:NitT/TauT family transport system substrate-binding protein